MPGSISNELLTCAPQVLLPLLSVSSPILSHDVLIPRCAGKKAKSLLESLGEKAAVFELDQMDEGSDWQVRAPTLSGGTS